MWTIGKGFDSEYPRKVRYGLGQPQNGVTWSWEDNKSCTIATVSDEVEESLQVFVPKKTLQHQFALHTIVCNIEEMQNLCYIIWLADAKLLLDLLLGFLGIWDSFPGSVEGGQGQEIVIEIGLHLVTVIETTILWK